MKCLCAIVFLLFVISGPARVSSEIFAISDQGYPHIYLMDPRIPVIWNKKFFASRMALSQGVRINSRGIRFIHPDHSIVDLLQHNSVLLAFSTFQQTRTSEAGGAGWEEFGCHIAMDSLCHLRSTEFVVSRMFPNFGELSYVFPVDFTRVKNLTTEIEKAMGGECPESSTGRTSILGIPSSTNAVTIRLDASVCNIIGAGGDFLFLPYDGKIFVLSRPIPFQMIVVISILTMVMSIVLAHNLEFSLGTSKSPTKTLTSLTCMVVLLLCSMFANGDPNFLTPYVTIEDRTACVSILCYVCYYTVRIGADLLVFQYNHLASSSAAKATNEKQIHSETYNRSPVNPVLATLSMVSLRLYSSMDNPYTIGIMFLVGTRLLHKLTSYSDDLVVKRECRCRICCCDDSVSSKTVEKKGKTKPLYAELLVAADIIADCAIISVYGYSGLVPQYANDSTMVSLVFLQGAYACLTLSKIISSSKRNNAAVVASPQLGGA